MNHSLISKSIAEMLGTFVFLGVIITVINDKSSVSNWLKIGFALSISIVLFGVISGGNFNPAVSFMLFMNNQLTSTELCAYIISQIIGAIFAYYYFITFSKE